MQSASLVAPNHPAKPIAPKPSALISSPDFGNVRYFIQPPKGIRPPRIQVMSIITLPSTIFTGKVLRLTQTGAPLASPVR